MRAIAIESGAFVVVGAAVHPALGVPRATSRSTCPSRDVYGRGGAVVVEPTWGEIVAGPLYDEEGMLVHDCDLKDGLHAKRWFDVAGHYSREDVLRPSSAPAPHGRDGAPVEEPAAQLP